jgi:hypothetical protein
MWQERVRERSVVDTTPVLAESTASIELAGEAEKAIAAKPEALEPGAYNEAGGRREVEMRGVSEGPSRASDKSHAQAKTSPSLR